MARAAGWRTLGIVEVSRPIARGQPGLTRSERLLLDLVGDGLDPERRDEVAAGVRSIDELWALARSEHLGARLAGRILGAPPAVARRWAPLRSSLERELREAHGRALKLRLAIASVLGELGQTGVVVAPIKGAWVAERFYERAHEREMGDLDFAVRDVGRAVAVLLAAGARRVSDDEAILASEPIESHHVKLLLPRAGGVLVELHFRLFAELPERAIADLLDRARPGTCGGVATRVPTDEDGLLVASHHLVHSFGRRTGVIRWWLDIDRMVRSAALDWELLLVRARAWAGPLALGLALAGAVQLFGAPVPDGLWSRLRGELAPIERRVFDWGLRRGATDSTATWCARRCGGPARSAGEPAPSPASSGRTRASRPRTRGCARPPPASACAACRRPRNASSGSSARRPSLRRCG